MTKQLNKKSLKKNINASKNKNVMKNENVNQNKNNLNQNNHNKTKFINKNEKNIKEKNNQLNNKKEISNKLSKNNIETDQRFAKAAYDPKFLRPKKQLTRIKVDDRFSKMLTDPAFQNITKVDKYGRKINTNSQQNGNKNKQVNKQLQQFYDFQQQQNQNEDLSEQMQQQNINEQNQQQYEEQNEQNQQYEEQQQQGIKKWMQNYDQQSSSLGDMPIQQILEQQNQGGQVWSDSQQNIIKNQKVKPTKRLALCNYDWMNINSQDLMILFNSFKSQSGYIKSIKVYQSILGKQKMQQQQMFGPQNIWKNQQEEDQFQQEQKIKNKNNKWRKSWKQLLKQKQSSSLDQKRLRMYEKQRLKYFYAVIQCVSKKTADQIYKQCDGNHFQNSNLQFDLRFIPDQISFDKNLLKQECNQMPLTGQIKNFVNRALGHSKVQLTWQDPQLTLAASLKKKNWGKMTQQQLNKIDWSTYLNQQQVDQQDNKRQLFDQRQQHQVISDWKKQCNKKYKHKSNNEQLVISFDTGFNSNKSNRKQSNSESLKKQKKSHKQLRLRAQQQKRKRKQQLMLMTDNNQQDRQKTFKPNVNDQRFNAVFNNPSFTIDPSNPKFDHRKNGTIFKELIQRNKQKNKL